MDAEYEELLVAAWDDWVSLGEARYIVSKHHPEADEATRRERTLGLVGLLLAHAQVAVGDVAPTFIPWELDADRSTTKIRELWTDPDDRLLPGDVCWIAITPAGRSAAEAIVARGTKQ